MKAKPFSITCYPQAILHLDADAFFASVEQAMTPSLKGKPLVTGKERGIIACASYEAKARGIKRGIPLFEAKKLCPELIILPNDYETYGLYSTRMFNIIRKYTPLVEEYSVDEAFADITGMRRLHRCSYEEIALKIQEHVRDELDITVSVGLSLSKTLAKLCSKFRKPRGFTAVPGRYAHILLQKTPLGNVCGFGPNTTSLLQKLGLRTAYDYAARSREWAGKLLGKPGRELWDELRGNSVLKVETKEKDSHASILKSKTFTPPSTDKAFVYAKLVRNVESAFIKARRYTLRPRALGLVLRRQDFTHDGLEAKLSRATSSTLEIMPVIKVMFDKVFLPDVEYRATMIVLGRLEDDTCEQFELFEDPVRIDSLKKVMRAVDTINRRYGKHAVRSGTTLFLERDTHSPRDDQPGRRQLNWKGENTRQRLGIPRSDIRV